MKILAGIIVWLVTFIGVWSLCKAASIGDEEQEKVLRQRRGSGP